MIWEMVDDFYPWVGIRECQMPASLNFATNSSTLATIPPPTRLGGSATLRVSNRGVMSTPRSAGLSVSMTFFLAFIMLGSEA